jgi:tripartite-type tricarboxylate transporter receptor subunit TctC
MKLPRRQFLHLAAGAAALPASTRIAGAQTYPSRAVTMIVPFPAGGPTDTLARIIVERMRASLGEPVIIENVSGAGGSIGVNRVAHATPDGYTVCFGQLNSNVFSGAVYNVSYDVLKDFEPVALLASSPQWVVARKQFPAKDLRELIAWLKANPDKATFGTVGIGSPPHIWGVQFQHSSATRFQFVPYRGAAPAAQDLIAGNIDIAAFEASGTLPFVRGGGIKAYAILAKTRWAAAPDIPTIDEAGLPGLYMPLWHGLWVPKGTPQDVIARLNAAAIESLGDPTLRQRLAAVGQEIFPRDQQTPEALGAFQKAEVERWWPIIKAANIKPE